VSELPKIDILMATYNGEKYIREQIESLQNQSYRNWTLLISDDGSTDNTLAIVEEMQKNRSSYRSCSYIISN
jgi:rhamnosyltransferase